MKRIPVHVKIHDIKGFRIWYHACHKKSWQIKIADKVKPKRSAGPK
ncbi:MAG: hypothetical protein QXL57_00520 [Candidatus Bathyarchaeia archaeon]